MCATLNQKLVKLNAISNKATKRDKPKLNRLKPKWNVNILA